MNPEELIETVVDQISTSSSDYNDGLDGWLDAKFDGDYLTITFEESNKNKNIISRATWKLVQIDE